MDMLSFVTDTTALLAMQSSYKWTSERKLEASRKKLDKNLKSYVVFDETPSYFDVVVVHIRVVETKWWKRWTWNGESNRSHSFDIRKVLDNIREDVAETNLRGLLFEAEMNVLGYYNVLALSSRLQTLLSATTTSGVEQSSHRPVVFIAVDLASLAIVASTINALDSRTAGLFYLDCDFPNNLRRLPALYGPNSATSISWEHLLTWSVESQPSSLNSEFPYPFAFGTYLNTILVESSEALPSEPNELVIDGQGTTVARRMLPDIKQRMAKFWPEELYDAIRHRDVPGQDVDKVESLIRLHRGEIATEPKVSWAMAEAARVGLQGTVQFLLRYNADADGRFDSSHDETPLMHAARAGHLEIVQMLLTRGADLSIQNEAGKTAKDLTTEESIIKLLENPPVVQGPLLDAISIASFSQQRGAQDKKPAFDAIPTQSTLVADIGCNKEFNGKIVDFTIQEHELHLPYSINVFELVYGHSPILHADVTFRWIHLPANNVVWVKDLLHKYYYEKRQAKSSSISIKGTKSAPSQPSSTDGTDITDPEFILNPKHWVPQQITTTTSTMAQTPSFTPRVITQDNSRSAIIYMPYLHYEMFESHKRVTEVVKSIRRHGILDAQSPEHKLMWAYLNKTGDLHWRRTLDQYYYPAIDTTSRDGDQVVYRETKARWKDEDPLILMVDQIWIVILDGDTVITTFPQRYKQNRGTPSKDTKKNGKDTDSDETRPTRGYIAEEIGDVVGDIMKELRNANRKPLQTVYDLTLLIIGRCTQLFLNSDAVSHEKLQFLDFFRTRIAVVRNKEAEAFAALHDDLKLLEGKKGSVYENLLKGVLDRLIDIGTEIKQLKEVKDIRDELNIFRHLLLDQMSVLGDINKLLKTGAGQKAGELKSELSKYLVEINQMDKEADQAYKALYNLLDLKQKQANVSEAHFSRRQAEDSGRQSTTFMIFTVTTVIFLPLSFLAAFYALQIKEFPQGPNGGVQMSLNYATSRIFGYSFACSIPLLLIAFGLNSWFNYVAKIRAQKQLRKEQIQAAFQSAAML